MKKHLFVFLLAVCLAVSALALPCAAASSGAAVQAALNLGGVSAEEAAAADAALTRGQLARLLAAFSAYRSDAQTASGRVFPDVEGSRADAAAIRVAVQHSWMSSYADGTFRPDDAVTLEQGCTAVLQLLGYDVTTLTGSYPTAQLQKASALGLCAGITATQGQTLTLEQGAQLVYNALSASTASGTSYGSGLGFVGTDGQVDFGTLLRSGLEGPFVAAEGTVLPFTPETVYRNESLSASAELDAYDVYYYNASAKTLWVYTCKAAGRITAVSPSASAPTSVTVAGTEYSFASSAASAQVSALNGGGVGQVVTLLLGMDNEVVQVLTGAQADAVYYGVVQSAARSLDTTNGADVLQTVTVACTDGVTRSVRVDKSLNYPAGWLVEVTVGQEGESVRAISGQSLSGTFSADGTLLGGKKLAADAEILETTADGLAATLEPASLAGVTLAAGDVLWYSTNDSGEITRLILNDVTGDLWTYGVLDDGKNLASAVSGQSASSSGSLSLTNSTAQDTDTDTEDDAAEIATDLAEIVLPSASELLYGALDGSIGSTLWESLTTSPSALASYGLQLLADNTDGVLGSVLGYLAEGGSYVCYIDGEQTTVQTSVKYPVVAGGIALRKSSSGAVKSMVQLTPTLLDQLGAASAMSGSTRYEMAADMQVYLWYKGQYYPTTLSEINAEDYTLVGWYDSLGHAAGGKIRVLVALRKS